jgi:hypothetical protein
MPLQAGDQLVAFDGKPGSVVLEHTATRDIVYMLSAQSSKIEACSSGSLQVDLCTCVLAYA